MFFMLVSVEHYHQQPSSKINLKEAWSGGGCGDGKSPLNLFKQNTSMMKKIEVHLYDEKGESLTNVPHPRHECQKQHSEPTSFSLQGTACGADGVSGSAFNDISLPGFWKPMPFNDIFTDICLYTTRIW